MVVYIGQVGQSLLKRKKMDTNLTLKSYNQLAGGEVHLISAGHSVADHSSLTRDSQRVKLPN